MTKPVIFIVGVVTGFLLAAAAYLYFALSAVTAPPKAQTDFTVQLIDKEQKRLGVACSESITAVRSYLDALGPVLNTLKNQERIDPSAPILSQGDKVSDIIFTCASLRNMANVGHLNSPAPAEIDDKELQSSVSAITLSVTQAAASWCEAKCLSDALVKITTGIGLTKERLANSSSVVGR